MSNNFKRRCNCTKPKKLQLQHACTVINFRGDCNGGLQDGAVLRGKPGDCPQRGLHLRPAGVPVPGEVGGPQQRDHQLRQYCLCHAHGLPVHYDGGLDLNTLLGRFLVLNPENSNKVRTSPREVYTYIRVLFT